MPNSKFTASYKDGKILKLETALCYDKETNEYYFYLYHNKCLFKKKRIGYIQFRIIYGDLSFEKLNISSAIKIWHNSIDKQYRGYQLGKTMMNMLCEKISESTDLPHTIIACPAGETPVPSLYVFYMKAGFKFVDEQETIPTVTNVPMYRRV